MAQPAASIAILTVVFTRFVRVDTGSTPYLLFSSVAVVPWTFMAASLADMTESFIQNMNLITKSAFRRETIPLAAMAARFVDFIVASAMILVLLVIYGRPVMTASWVALPVILAIQVAVILGVGLACATINVFYRDVRSVLVLAIQVWFYASPIIYPVSLVPESLRASYFLNPMVGVLQAYRDVLLNNAFPGTYLVSSALVAGVLLASGVLVFRRLNNRFADII